MNMTEEVDDVSLLSKIISIQTIKGKKFKIFVLAGNNFQYFILVHNSGLDVDLACLFWALINNNKNTSSYYLTIFNLNNWYSQCMPAQLDKKKRNFYLNSFNICLNSLDLDYTSIKVIIRFLQLNVHVFNSILSQ